MKDFHCKLFNVTMPEDKQRGFCALRFRSEKMICIDCETGRTAAKEERDMPMKKTCVDCGKEYEATSNVQKRCVECKEKNKADGGGRRRSRSRSPQEVEAANY
jgi:ribosomal protein L34E